MSNVGIGQYGFLSDGHAPALLSASGSVDWWCPPRADQPPAFGRLLDPGAGHWILEVQDRRDMRRRYLPGSLVVETLVTTPTGRVRMLDALAMEPGARSHDVGRRSPQTLVRSIEALQGTVTVRCEFAPRFEFGLTAPQMNHVAGGLVAEAGPTRLRLSSPYPLDIVEATASCSFEISEGERAVFSVAHAAAPGAAGFADVDSDRAIENAQRAWASWADAHPGYEGPRAESARQSALVLQGLTFKPTGAVLAAATTSVPAAMGGTANWDYRYAWLRDLSLTANALWIAACPDEAAQYLTFLTNAAGTPVPGARVQIVYGVDGRRDLAEHELAHLDGFANSRPVRTGNAAWDQSQLDVMGEVLDMAHRFVEQLAPFEEATQRLLVWLADEAAETWSCPDAGMWEARDRQRHYLSSKVMCWVALDRAVHLAPLLGDRADPERWAEARDHVRDTVLREGWSDDLGAYSGAFGSDRLDASVLLLPLVGFLAADEPRMRATIDAIDRELTTDGLVYRWDGDTNGFVLCSYWLVECLALAGERERAEALFDQLTARSNDLGLFAEQIDPRNGEMTGNFPQAFSHVGLINAAWRLDTLDDHNKETPQWASSTAPSH